MDATIPAALVRHEGLSVAGEREGSRLGTDDTGDFERPASLAGPASQRPLGYGRAGLGNQWVLLDSAWAARLGVKRECGVYRIRRRELVERLQVLDLRSLSAGQLEAAPGRTVEETHPSEACTTVSRLGAGVARSRPVRAADARPRRHRRSRAGVRTRRRRTPAAR